MYSQLLQMYRMAVWDNAGRMYLPVWDYENKEITNYARANEALKIFNEGEFHE